MKMNISSYKLVLIPATLVITVTGWAMSTGKLKFTEPATVRKPAVIRPVPTDSQTLDTGLVRQLERALNQFDPNKPMYTITGSIDVTDKGDSTKNAASIDFVLCKKDSAFYYRIGKTEAINENGVNLNIDNTGKKIFMTGEKKIQGLNMLTAMQLYEIVENQHFHVSGSVQGPVKTIRLLNEDNVACKEYAISLDTLLNTVTRIYTRQPSPTEPMNTKKDRTTDLKIFKVQNKASLSDYTRVVDVIDKRGNPKGNYKTYRIINL